MDQRLVAALVLLLGACGSAPAPLPSPPPSRPEADLDPGAIRQLMADVADRALQKPLSGWTLPLALLALSDIAEDPRYLMAVRSQGESQKFLPSEPALAMPYLGLFLRERDRRTLAPTRTMLDGLSRGIEPETPPREPLMIAPALAMATAVTADSKYLAAAEARWWKAAEPLYDAGTHLFRGNHGWALFALIRLLGSLPDDHAARPRLEAMFRDAAGALVGAQDKDGRWGAETALAVHALGWGFNQGLLPSVEAAVRRGWIALTREPGDDPAAFLFAGSEVFRLALFEGSRAAVVSLANPLAEARFGETAEIPWPPLARALGAVPGDPVVVVEGRSGRLLASQLLDADGDALAEHLLVSLSLLGSESRRLIVRRLARPYRQPPPIARTHGRFVPEAEDDFAWENDRVAFRVYGPAVEPKHLSSGIDVWAKKVRTPVIDRWYKDDYHRDRGEGLDFYRVGPTRGCGGLGLWRENKLYTSRNFRRWRLIAEGPVRVLFELGYQAWGPPGAEVTETKRISLDLGQHLSRVESRFSVRGAPVTLPVAVGVMRRGEGTVARDFPTTWVSYVEPPQGESGQIGCGVVGAEAGELVESEAQYLLVHEHPSNRPFVYYAGAYWSKAPDFRVPDDWGLYLAAFSRRASAPVTVTVAPAAAPR